MFSRMIAGLLAAMIALPLMIAAEPQSRQKAKESEEKKTKGTAETKDKRSGEKSDEEVILPGLVPTSTRTLNGASYPLAARGFSYSPGELKVVVKGDLHPVIGIGMAPFGVTMIEFPANDFISIVHPPALGDVVRVETSKTQKTDHHLTLKAGLDLADGPGPAASIEMQMTSGLIITFWVYPTKSVTGQTHRCVISYDRNEIVEARKRAGLAVELPKASAEDEMVASNGVAAPPQQRPEEKPSGAVPKISPDLDPKGQDKEQEQGEKNENESLSQALKRALKDGMNDSKTFKTWSGPTHGLSVATKARDLDEQTRIALVAVKNVEDEAIRILPGHPDLVVETLNEKGKVIQLKRLKKLFAEASTKSNVIPAQATVYYALAFTPPILGSRQRLRVSVGQQLAADDPAGASLTAVK
jgi:hypothetical protein